MAAGLKNNQSLKNILIVNPALKEGDPNKKILEERIFSVFKKNNMVLKLLPFETGEFFNPYPHDKIEQSLGRKYPLV